MLRKSKKGFTLLEILVVAAIVGLVASVFIVMLHNARMKARDAKRYAEIDALKKALELHYDNNDKYPEVADWIKIEQDADENGPFSTAMRPYLSRIPRDPLYPKIEDGASPKVFSYQYKSTEDAHGYKLHIEMETGTYFETSYEVYVGEGINLTYTPTPAPTVNSVTPNNGTTAGETAVTISGGNFVNGATVTFGGTPATGVAVVSDTAITAITPAHASGAVDVIVTNPDTQSGTLTNGFTYVEWWNTSWSNRIKLTFNNSASVENLYDFPILVSLTSTEIDYAKTQNQGQDIRFVDTDNATQLKYEIEKWDEAGTSVVWVKVPQIDAGSTTDFIWMYYNNSSAVYEQTLADEQAVWSSGFKMVQHLQETSGTHEDSTDQNNDGAAGGGVIQNATGKIDGADGFTGTLDYVEVGTSNWSVSQGTVEVWGYPTATTYSRYFFGHTTVPVWNNRIQLYTDDTTGNLNLGLGDDHYRATNIQTLTPATWYHIVLTWNGSNYIVYVDGVSKASGTYTGLSTLQTFADIGNDGYLTDRNEGFNGTIDEVRVSNIVRSANWIGAQYKSMNSTFVSFGSEESY